MAGNTTESLNAADDIVLVGAGNQFKSRLRMGSAHARQCFAAILSLCLIGNAAPAGHAHRSSGTALAYDITKVEADFERECANGSFSGVVVVRAHERELFSQSCGDADIINHIPNTRQTRGHRIRLATG